MRSFSTRAPQPRRARPFAAAALALLASGCSVGPNFVRPTPQTGAHWSARATASAEAARSEQSARRESVVDEESAQSADWWNTFQDPVLSSLVARSTAGNLDLRAAALRIQEARAQRDVTAAPLWPSLTANASFSRTRLSQTTPTGSLFSSIGSSRIPGAAGISIPNPYNQYQAAGDASWEIDLFGRLRRSVEAANAGVEVSVEDRHAVLISLLGDVAQRYIELRGAQSQLSLTEENLATVNELLELTRARRAAGLTSDLDVTNAMAQVSATRAQLPAFELQITQNINQLSQLIGREPEALRAQLGTAAPIPPVPPQVPIGLPADLARRRPDIREAEANLHAATAQVGVAVASLFPRLTLSASGGLQSETTSKLTQWASRFGSLGPALDLPVFDRGRWKSVPLQKVRAQEAALAYQSAVLNALHEVENALAAYGADQDRRVWLASTVAQDRDALMLARQRYESGVTSFIDVLDAERTVQQNELSLVESTTAVSTDLVRLYRALGGGWQSTAAAEP